MRRNGSRAPGCRTRTRGPQRIVWAMGLVALVALVVGCGGDAPEGPSSLTHDQEAIRAADGSVVFHGDSLPAEVVVAEGTAFGSSGRITGVVGPSATGKIAFTSIGVAHGFGWLLDPNAGEPPEPAVFQYGGRVVPVGWDDLGRFVAFTVETPAGSTELRVTDAQAEERFPDGRTRAISVPEAESLSPEERIYADPAWEAGVLCFTLEGERHCVDPAES